MDDRKTDRQTDRQTERERTIGMIVRNIASVKGWNKNVPKWWL